jgi:hypothetical protein
MTITADPAGLADLKQFTRATWAVGERIVQRVGIGKNERCLMSPAAQATRRSEPRKPVGKWSVST